MTGRGASWQGDQPARLLGQLADADGARHAGGGRLGLDCLVDDTLKPWILECNLSPSLGICAAPEHGGCTEEAVKGGLVHDLVSLVDIPAEAVSEAGAAAQVPDDAARLVAEAKRARGGTSCTTGAVPAWPLPLPPHGDPPNVTHSGTHGTPVMTSRHVTPDRLLPRRVSSRRIC